MHKVCVEHEILGFQKVFKSPLTSPSGNALLEFIEISRLYIYIFDLIQKIYKFIPRCY